MATERYQSVTLLPECCTGALCSCCSQHKENLLKCGRCKRAWYCSKEHQQQHYKEHKQSCRAAAPFVDALIESVEEAKPSTYAEIQKLIVGASIFAQRNGPQGHIGHNLFMMVSNTMYCRVCFKLREQLPPGNPLVCCPKCLWGWTCKPHRQEFQPQHEPVCEEYASMQRLGVMMREQAAVALFAGNQLPYPMAKVTQLQQAQLLDSWQRYRRLRVPSVTNDDTWKCMTADLTIPLTAVWATRQLYSKQQLASMQEFNLHLVGAAQFEFDHVVTNTAIEEVLHLLPPVKVVRVVLVGPEYKRITSAPQPCSNFDKDVCPPCRRLKLKRVLTIFRGTYEEYAASKDWNEPTLALACNSGVGCEDEASWAKALKVLLDKSTPCCFTSMNAEELQLDGAALKKAGASILHSGRNPFGSLVPFRDIEAEPDEFYYQNGWVTCFKGREGAGAGAGSSSSSSSA